MMLSDIMLLLPVYFVFPVEVVGGLPDWLNRVTPSGWVGAQAPRWA